MPKIDNKDLYLGILTLVFVVAVIAIRDEEKLKIIKNDFSNWGFSALFILITILTVTGLIYGNKRVKNTVRHAMVAFMIAYFAHIDMDFAAFFLVGIFVYFTDDTDTT
uniref:Uncharacterized protein n=1 Tax=viral metagenome TaxID=1070528 RepID=A0A6C0EKR4_9ZZZZ